MNNIETLCRESTDPGPFAVAYIGKLSNLPGLPDTSVLLGFC